MHYAPPNPTIAPWAIHSLKAYLAGGHTPRPIQDTDAYRSSGMSVADSLEATDGQSALTQGMVPLRALKALNTLLLAVRTCHLHFLRAEAAYRHRGGPCGGGAEILWQSGGAAYRRCR